MDFVRGGAQQLRGLVAETNCIGGSNVRTEQDLFAHVRREIVEKVEPGISDLVYGLERPVAEIFKTCWYRPADNARRAEDELIEHGPTHWNTLGTSGNQEAPGFVYVLVV